MDLDNITDRLVATRDQRLASKDRLCESSDVEQYHSRDQRASSIEKKSTYVEGQERPKDRLKTYSSEFNDRDSLRKSQSQFVKKSNKRLSSTEAKNDDEMLKNL